MCVSKDFSGYETQLRHRLSLGVSLVQLTTLYGGLFRI